MLVHACRSLLRIPGRCSSTKIAAEALEGGNLNYRQLPDPSPISMPRNPQNRVSGYYAVIGKQTRMGLSGNTRKCFGLEKAVAILLLVKGQGTELVRCVLLMCAFIKPWNLKNRAFL